MALFTEQTYRANGKLLLSAEYFVLDGALALALPTQLGQSLKVSPGTEEGILHWQSLGADGNPWFSGQFNLSDGQCSTSDNKAVADRLEEILLAIRQQAPGFLPPGQSWKVETRLEFPRQWGLGSSSTLIATLAQWAGVDPFQLLADTFGGSGYDIACANAPGPIFYQIRDQQSLAEPCAFHPSFSQHLYFVYLGHKQNSREGIAHYRQIVENKIPLIDKISSLTKKMQSCDKLHEFAHAVEEHEALIAESLNLEPVKMRYFSDFWGSVKSLGAWGGDFVLLCSDRPEEETRTYCNEKGFDVFFNYNELIL